MSPKVIVRFKPSYKEKRLITKVLSLRMIYRDFMFFISLYQEIEQVSGHPPAVTFESTGHYHEPVLQFLDDHEITYFLINPVVSFEARKTSLRRVKTDKADAYHLGELYYKEDLEVFKKKTDQSLNLRQLTRQHSALTDSYVDIKLQFQAALDQMFPEYHGVFSDLYGIKRCSGLQPLSKACA